MNFGFTEEQELLRQEVRKFLDAHCDTDEVRRISETSAGYSPELWKQISELGWQGLTIGEEFGGAGLGFVDWVVLLEETGRTLFPSPLVSNTLAAVAVAEAGSDEQKKRWLPGLADGSRIGTLALLEASDRLDPAGIELRGEANGDDLVVSGEKCFVPDVTAADLFVVALRSGDGPGDLSLVVIEADASGVSVENTPVMDLTKRQGTLRLDDVRVRAANVLGSPGGAAAAIARTLDVATAAVTAEAIGAAEGAHALTTRYASERIQFGEPIGRFQGVKHPLAEMYVDIESFKSLLYYGAWGLDERDSEASRTISMAKAYASEAFTRIGVDCVQLHGGIGYTWEYDAHLYLKRSKWLRPAYGDADHHYERIAELGGL